jgi:predicted ribosome quality control (RQC) complex YloA/Tae2 family protein
MLSLTKHREEQSFMHYDVLVPVVEEISSLLTGARVERVLQGDDRGLYLLFRKDRKNFSVLLSPDRSLPRLHLVSRKPRSASDPHPLVLNLRSRLPGSRLAHIALLNDDRIVEFRFVKNGAGYRIFFELTGSSANLFFSDADLRILAVYHPAPAEGQAGRLLVPGVQYVLPQKKAGRAPHGSLVSAAQKSPNERAESYYGSLAIQRHAASLRTELRSSLAKALKRAERRRAAIAEDLRTAHEAETFRQKGDLILANLGKLKTGMSSVELSGYDGDRTALELDAKLTPKENAESYFRKYKKAKAGLPIIEERMRRTEEEIADMQARIGELEQADDGDLPLFSRRGTRGAPSVESVHKEVRRKSAGVSGIRKFLYRGWEILVGGNAAANDELSAKLARPDDLWLHAEGLPGSHILVRNPMKGEIPSEILLKAAGMAAMHSKGKTAGKVAVTYTYARFVRKPKGAKPGLVHLTRRRTVMVKPDDDPAH